QLWRAVPSDHLRRAGDLDRDQRTGEVACGPSGEAVVFGQLGHVHLAPWLRPETAGMEMTSAGRVGRAGYVTLQDDPGTRRAQARIGDRDGRKQRLGVGM